MTQPPMAEAVHDALTDSQHLGFLGERPIDEVIEHARSFVAALEGINGTVIDLGAGGGVPGLVIAHDRPDLHLVMIDRRVKRTDFLRRVVTRLGWSEHVDVVTGDVTGVATRSPGLMDAAIARGFGPPDVTLSLASQLVRPGGRIVISEPPSGNRWAADLIADLEVYRIEEAVSQVAVFERDSFT